MSFDLARKTWDEQQGELLRIGTGGVVPVRWEAEKSGTDPGTLTGWASVYSVVDQQDDVVVPGAFRKTITEWRATKRVIPLTLDHQNTAEGVIGSLADAEDTAYGLKTTFRFSATPKAQEARTKAREGHLNGLSIFGPIFNKAFDTIEGKSVRLLKEVGLFFVGLTPMPANTSSLVLTAKAIVDSAWDGSAARFTPEQWRRSCLIDTGEGDVTSKSRYKLPVREPDGDINRNGVHAAAAALAGGRGGVNASAEQKARAARALIRMYGQMDEEPPESLRRIAGTMSASLTLPDVWVADMRSALAITSPVAQKAAIDSLVADMYHTAPEVGATEDDARPAETGGDEDESEALTKALALIGDSGPDISPPGGEPSDSLAGLLASIDAEKTLSDLDGLEAEIKKASEL